MTEAQYLTDGNADGSSQGPDAEDQTAGNGDELSGDGQLRGGDEGDECHAERPSHQDDITPHRRRRGLVARGHAHKEGNKDEEGAGRHPTELFRAGAIETGRDGGGNGGSRGYRKAARDEEEVGLIQDADLERKIVVDGKVGDAFAEDADQGNGIVVIAMAPEETVVKHAVLLELGFIHNQGNAESNADGEGG